MFYFTTERLPGTKYNLWMDLPRALLIAVLVVTVKTGTAGLTLLLSLIFPLTAGLYLTPIQSYKLLL